MISHPNEDFYDDPPAKCRLPQVINDQFLSNENTSKKLMSVSIELKYMKWIT